VCHDRPGERRVAGALLGRFRFESEASRFRLQMRFPSQGYPEESLALESGKPEVASSCPASAPLSGTS